MMYKLILLCLFGPVIMVSCNSPGKKKGTTTTSGSAIIQVPQDCDFEEYALVTGENNRCFLNKCWALKMGVQVSCEGYQKKNFKKNDTYTWPIEQICKPIQEIWDTIAPIDLEDGTLIYVNQDGSKFRGTPNRCRCLSALTNIATPKGQILVSEIIEGDSVFTLDENGHRSIARIRAINRVKVDSLQKILDIELADGRNVRVSPGHPITKNYLTIDQCVLGDSLDGSIVVRKTYYNNPEEYTYDILPYGNSAAYWANDILLQSTMRGMFYTEDLLRMGW